MSENRILDNHTLRFKPNTKNILGCYGGSHERRLLNDLMTHYQRLERPVVNESQAVTLKFGLTLQQILDVVSRTL